MIPATGVVVGTLFAAGLYLFLSPNLQRMALGFLLLSNAVNLLVIAVTGLPADAQPPLLNGEASPTHADPLPQAFILTAIVIGLGTLAWLLAMAVGLHQVSGRDELGEGE